MKKTLFVAAATVLSLVSMAQERPKNNPRESQLIFWNYPDNYLQHQRAEALATVDEVLLTNPPATDLSLIRKSALLQLDIVTHDQRNDNSVEVLDFINLRIKHLIDDLDKPVKKGVRIFKLYNDGFIIKSSSAIVGIDIVRGGNSRQRYISDELIAQIAGKCDMLLITHKHGDHRDPYVIECFKNAGKDVFEPVENAQPSEHLLTHGVKLNIVPGHQDDMPNNIYFITNKEGFTIAHTGDQYNEEDMPWIRDLHLKYKTDVLIVHCWAMHLMETIAGFSPRYVISGHENELEHTIDHREAAWMSMKKFEKSPCPAVFMTWGESWYLKK